MYKHLHFIKAPLVYWQYTSTRVLTMEFCEGGKLDDLSYIEKHGLPVDEVCVCVHVHVQLVINRVPYMYIIYYYSTA